MGCSISMSNEGIGCVRVSYHKDLVDLWFVCCEWVTAELIVEIAITE